MSKINLEDFEDWGNFEDENPGMKTNKPSGFGISRAQVVREVAKRMRDEQKENSRVSKKIAQEV